MVITLADGGTLEATSTEILSLGYLAIFKDLQKEEEFSALSKIEDGEHSVFVTSGEITEKETQPPSRYTQSSLANDMTRIARYVDDKEMKEILLQKDKGKRSENGSFRLILK